MWFTFWSFYWYAPLNGTLRGTYGEVAFPNISARDINDYFCAFPSVTSAMSGAIFFSELIKSCAELIVESMEEFLGMLNVLVEKYTVFEISSALVLGMYDLWNL